MLYLFNFSVSSIKKHSICYSYKRYQHHKNSCQYSKKSCSSSTLTKVLSDHNKSISISKISYRPNKEPNKSYKIKNIKEESRPISTQINLHRGNKQINTNWQPYQKNKETNPNSYSPRLYSKNDKINFIPLCSADNIR